MLIFFLSIKGTKKYSSILQDYLFELRREKIYRQNPKGLEIYLFLDADIV